MSEEGRVFARTAVYALIVAVIYGVIAREVAGTVLLAVLGLAAAGLTAMMPGVGRPGLLDLARFDERETPSVELEEAPLPTLSIQPLVVAAGAAGVTLGLVFGAWLWLPSSVVLFGSAWRWLTELD